jgi:hypothetical protein
LHSDALAPLYLPAGHTLHEPEPPVGWCLPAGHASQYVILAADWYLPVSHPAQWATDACDCTKLPYRPAVHCVQLTLVSKLHVPAAHCPLHELLVEPPVPNQPAAQSTHAVRPASL